MASIFQVWDKEIQGLAAESADDAVIEARRQQLAEHFKAKAKASGLSSKKIYETLDQFDTYSRQHSTNEDNRLSPEEEEMAQRSKDGTERTGAMLEVGKAVKDAGIGALSSLAGWGAAIAQTGNDVGENDKSELSSQVAQGLYNVRDELQSNYSEGTKSAKKDFWTPRGLAMGLAENAGQIAGSATVFGLAGKFAKAREFSRGATLLTAGAVGAPLAYSQGYGQGKENSLDEINKTSNAQLWENVKAEAKAYDDAGGTGEVPYLVKQFKEAGGDLNLMKDLMAENAGNVTGLMTVGTEPLAMGVGSLMSRGAAAGGKGLRAGLVNAMNNQGMSNELARRIAAGASAAEARKAGQIVGTTALRDNAAIASQVAKIAAVQGMRGTGQEGIQEGGEGYIAKTEGSLAAGRKGELTGEDWGGQHGIIEQGLQGAAIGGIMAGGSVYSSARNASKLALEKNGLPEKHDAAITAHEQAIANLEKATQILDLNPEDVKAQEVHAKAYDEALVATNNLEQLTGKFNALYTPEEQEVIKAKTMEGVAARAKVAEDAAKAQQELDAAQAKATQEQQAQQNEIIKAQRENTVNKLASMVGDEVALNEELARLNLGAEEENSLVTEAHKVAKKQKKAEKQAQSQAQAKPPLDSALDMLFDNKGNRNTKDAQDAADAHKVQLVDLVPAIAQRIESNKQQQTQAERQNKKAEYEKTKVREAEQAANKEKLTDKQQLENTLADFARNNDHDSMVNFLRDYDPKEADTLIANAYKAVDKETKAAQDAVTANQKAEALKVKESEAKTQAEQKKIAFNQDMADLHATNPNATMADLNVIGKKHGVKSPIELAKAWVKAKNEAKAAPKKKETLALPAPENVMVADAQGNVIPTTENNVPKKPRSNDFSVPSGLKVDVSNAENTRSDLGIGSYIGSAYIVRQDGQPFPTEQVAQQALENKATKKPRRKNKQSVSKDTHSVVPVDGGFAIAPKSEQQITQEDIIGEYARDTSPNDIIKLVKTETGYELDFDGISTYYDGEDSLKKAKSFLRKYGFKKIKPKAESEWQATPKEPVVEQPIEEVKQEPVSEPKVEKPIIDDLSGDYAHTQLPDAVATVSKTEKGYDINWGDEVQSVTGKNAAEKTQAALKKEGFSKKTPDNDNGGVPVEPVAPKTVSPIGGNSAPQAAPKTDAEQIASAMDKTAQAITDAAHSKVVERIKDGEEIVYKQPAAIERAKQDDRYQVEINDKGYAVVKNIKDLNGEWVKKDEPIAAEATHIENGKVEEVTNEIIRESLAKVDDKPVNGRTMSLKEAKQWLLDSIDAAIAVAKYKTNKDILGANGEKNPKNTDYITFDVPNDGKFKVLNTIESLQKFKGNIEKTKGFTENQKPTKPFSAPSENSPETTIMGFLNDGELENAYFFAENQKKPIRFTLSNKKEPIAYFLTEPVDLGNNITGFVGISTDPMSKSKRWLVIEEKSRTSIGFEEISKQAAIKSAKARLSALKKEDLDRLSSTIKPINKTDQEMSVEWLAKNNIKTDDEKTEQQNINKKSAAIENLYDLALGAAKATQIKADRDKNKPVDFAANTFEDKWQKAINGDAKAIKDIRDYFVNNKRVPNMTKAHLIIFEGLTNQDFTSKTYEYVASKFDEYINGFSDVNTNNSSTQKFMPTFDDVMTHLKGIHNLSSESFSDAQSKALVKNTLEDYLDKVMPNDVSAKDFKAITDKFFNELVSSYPQTEYKRSGRMAYPIPEIAKRTYQPTKKESLLIKIDDELDAALDDLANVFKEQGKRLSSGVDPVIMGKVLAIGMKASTLYLAKGAVKFAVWAENMIASLSSKGVSQDLVEPYLKGLYAASKMQVSPEIRKQMDKEDDVYDFDFAILNQAEDETNKLGSDKLVFKNIDELKKWAAFNANNKKTPISFQRIVGVDDSVYYFENKKEWESDTLNNTPLVFVNENQIKLKDTQNELSQLDSTEKTPTTKETLTDLFYKHLKQGTLPENNVNLRKMVAEFDGKEVDNYRLKEAQEMLEAAIARHSRDVVASNHNGDASTFNQLVDAYNKQPNLNIRTSTSVENQAYSTPAPLAFVAAKMANIGKNTTVYEPTAGNGMLLITALPENATVNEMESTRFNNLKDQGFNAHQGDALKAIENGVVKPNSQDAIITNPPFGSIKENGKTVKVAVDGYKIGKIDHLIAVEALKAMKPNGTAAIIIGADMVQGGISTDDRIFFNWLYANYNVVGHFEVDGKLYSRQGASWPVRVIIVHGKQASDKNSPVTGAIPRYDNWKDVYDQYTKMVVASNNRGLSSDTSSANNAANDTTTPQNVDGVKTTQIGTRGRNTTRNNDDVDGTSTRNVSNRSGNGGKQLPVSDNVQRFDERTNAQDNLAVGDNRDTGVTTGNDSRSNREPVVDGNTRGDVAVLSDADNSFQVKYTPASSRKDEGVLIPINMRQPLMDSLLTLEDNVGDIDKYAAKELGYKSVAELHYGAGNGNGLMGLQVDSVASAIYQIKEKNKGIIIADQTGIGKGRQAAAIIRWAILNGHTPVFVTVKPQLFTDMYGDLSDIGSNDVKPFIVNTGESISGKDGKKLHKTKPDAKHRKEVEDIAGDGVLPDDYNAVFITYSQINKTNNQQRLLSALSGNAIFILDESHNAGGASSTGMFMQEVLKEAKGVVYLSATFAKRPDNMPLYFKTDMGLAVGDTNELSTAVMQGGLPLQTVISNALVKAGQLFRRERSYNGVSIETKVDSTNKIEHEKLSDEATKALRAIVAADRMFHNTYFKQLEKAAEEEGKQARAAGNKAEKSVNHHEFSSVVHNFIRQMLLGLKVDTAANEAIAALKRGEKPVIALENTMGSFLNEYVSANGLKEGDSLGDFGYRDVLSRALHRTRAVTIKDKKGEETRKEVGLHELDSATRAAYDAAQKIIDSLDVTIPASPIDWMRSRIEKAGYTVAEITGRNTSVDYSTETPTVSQVPLSEQNDKVGTTRMFNSGELDAIILNVAGSTGISLHASEKFKDQRIRHMIVVQPAQDINIFMQMLGRIHRTGQVVLPKYTILSLDLPTEKRPTAVLNKKMKSLNANTSSNTESATSIVSMDMLNKYGDKVVAAYLSENQDIAKKIGMEVHGDTSSAETNDDFAKKATGRFALLPIQEQNKIYEEIEPQYAALISYLDETGQNELEPKTIDFEAELKLESTAVPATDPSTPFGQEAIYGEYKVKPQGKPMSVDEVKALIVKNIGEGVMPAQHTQKLLADGQSAFDSFINTLNERYKTAENEEEAGIIQKNIANQQAVFENTKSFIESHRVGSIWQIDIKGDIYNAVITNVKSTFKKGGHGNPFAQSKILISLAVNGELRSVTVPMTEFSRIEVTKYYGTAQDALKPREGDAGLAKIITGNLLAGYANLVGSDGRVISFTKKDGTTEQGILLPKKFNFKDNVRQDFAIKNASDVFKLLKSNVDDISKTGVASRKGDIRIVYNKRNDVITIYTPKSKSTGGKWFLNKKLIDIVGDFVSSGNMMTVDVPSKKAIDALSIVVEKTPLYVLPSQAEATKELLGYHEGQVNLKEDKPKFSRGTSEGLTTSQVRQSLVNRFGEKLIKALEAKGLLTIMATPPSWAEPDTDGAYHNGKIYLFTDNLTPETVVATFTHELSGHKGFQEMMSPKAYEIIMAVFDRLVAQGNPIAVAAKKRAQQAEDSQDRQTDEYIPYLLTEQEKAHQATKAQRNAVQRLIDHIVRAVKGWLFNQLTKYDITTGLGKRVSSLLDARDIQLMAEKMIREMGNGTKPSNNTKAKVSQFSQLNTPQTQINAVRRKYEGTSQWMKAPNGQPTKLNEMQWLQVRTPNFKAWFGDWEGDAKNASKVIDENGEPLVVYHGTKSEFTEFDISQPIANGRGEGVGFYFTPDKKLARRYAGRKGFSISAFLSMKNDFRGFDSLTSEERQVYLKTRTDEEAYEKLGIDGFIQGTQYIVRKPTQIKSTGNTGEFNPTNPDIRFSRTEQKPRSSSLDNFIAKAIAEKAWLTTEQINLLNSATTFDELIPLLDKVWNQYFEAKKLKNNNSTKTAVGVDNIKALIRSEVDSGHITKEHGDLALYFAEKNPALFDSLKSLSFQNDAETSSGNPVAGVYSVVDKVIRISRRTNSPLTTAHEVLHHAEEFLPENIKSSIIKAWQNDLIRAFKSAENGSNRKTMLHAIIHSIVMGDMSAIEKAIDSMDGVIPANTYHLFNPAEYWAENASRLMNNRSKRQDTWIENARSWINGLIQTLKNALGLQNDAAILKGLRMVLSGSQLKEGGKGIDIDHVYNMKMLNLFSYIGKFNHDGANKTKTSNEKYSRQSKNPITEGIKSAANDAKNSLPKPISGKIDHFLAGRRLPSSDLANIVSKTELSLYHRTISTQQNTALQLPDFKKVYDMAQRYLQHVSVDAYAALQAAPNLLGQLETWSDLKKEFKKAWYPTYVKQKTDRAAVAEVIFDETLNNELRSEEDILKSLSRDQRRIYKEARDAIEISLKNTAKSEMVRKLLAAEAINWNTVESLMDKNQPVEQFAQAVRDLVESRIGGLSNELEAILDSDKMVKKAFKTGKVLDKDVLSKAQRAELKQALFLKEQIDTTKEALKSLNDVEKRLDTLLEQGYAPLMRFGEYTLTVRGQDDKVQSFFMFETKAEQARAANAIVARYGKTVKLETDMISKEEFKQFAGMTPETMALFAKETGMDKDEAYQRYLKLAIPARSAMTRMIKRKGTAGFSDDIQRVVASFVMSNARMAAKNIYAAQIEKSIQAIESGKSVKDQAIVMKENVFNPKENFAQLRNILFLWNLGGSIFFGLLNMTQPYMQTLPHLSQYVPIADAGKAILRGSKIAGSAMKNGHAPKGYEAEYNRAVREGHVDPQNVFMLSGVERGKTGLSNSWTSILSHLMGSIAQVTESFNRKAVFIASIDVANKKGDAWLKKHGFATAYDFAVDSIAQTQGVYNKANRSNWANTSVGAPLMTFKQFSINYVEQMVRMWKKEAASGDEGKKAVFLMLAMLASLSGVMGLPFIKDILDVSETTAAFLGNPVNIEREARLALGKDLADPLFNGVLNHFVFNNLGMDIQGRTGMPDLVPWSNALNPTLSAQGRVNEFASIAGATGGLIEKGYDATQLIARGNIGTAALTLMPRSITSAFTGGKMAVTDEVMDSKGNKLFDTTWDEGLVKFIDANPKRMADLSRTKSLEWKDKSIQAYMTTNFKQKIIAAMMDNDQAEVQNLMKKVQEWNTSRPNYPVFINLNTLSKNANKKDQTFDARESIPKGMDWMKNERPEM